MTISESQLEDWSHQQGTNGAKKIYKSIKNAIHNRDRDFYDGNTPVTYLQGSYKNHTNVYAESDVDVIIQLDDPPFIKNLEDLDREERERYNENYNTISHTWNDFYSNVMRVLKNYYLDKDSYEIKREEKCVKLYSEDYRDADIVIAYAYRKYHKFPHSEDQESNYTKGIHFETRNDREIKNYPEQHAENGSEKNTNCNENYKPIVRIFKNMRYKLKEENYSSGEISSYFIECLLYNVDAENFSSNYQESVEDILDFLEESDLETFDCQNEMRKLVGSKPQQVEKSKVENFISDLREFWDD